MKVTAIKQLVNCINSVKKQKAAFLASEQIDLGQVKDAIEIEGIGPLKLPMRPKDVRELIARADSAPYGKGTETIVDSSVRDSLEINASCLTFSNQWNAAIARWLEMLPKNLDCRRIG